MDTKVGEKGKNGITETDVIIVPGEHHIQTHVMAIDCSFGLGYLPVMWGLFTFLAFAASYGMAVLEGHVYPILPSISDTGTRIPEANVFSLLMNISIILALANYFTRYFQCQHQARHCGDNRENIFKYNHISLLLAITSLVGALVVANVQSRKVNNFFVNILSISLP